MRYLILVLCLSSVLLYCGRQSSQRGDYGKKQRPQTSQDSPSSDAESAQDQPGADSDNAIQDYEEKPDTGNTVPNPAVPTTQQTPSPYQGGNYYTPGNGSGYNDGATSNPNPNSNVIEFSIQAGNGQNRDWNTSGNPVTARRGQKLRITNNDSIQHWLHTEGAPFPHPNGGIRPGQSVIFDLSRTFSGRLRGHEYVNAGLHLQVSQ